MKYAAKRLERKARTRARGTLDREDPATQGHRKWPRHGRSRARRQAQRENAR
jgi:hypothetical protein